MVDEEFLCLIVAAGLVLGMLAVFFMMGLLASRHRDGQMLRCVRVVVAICLVSIPAMIFIWAKRGDIGTLMMAGTCGAWLVGLAVGRIRQTRVQLPVGPPSDLTQQISPHMSRLDTSDAEFAAWLAEYRQLNKDSWLNSGSNFEFWSIPADIDQVEPEVLCRWIDYTCLNSTYKDQFVLAFRLD